MSRKKLILSIMGALLCGLVGALLLRPHSKTADSAEVKNAGNRSEPTEVRTLHDKYEQIQENMHESEVDSIMAGYRSRRFGEAKEYEKEDGLSRIAVRSKLYDEPDGPMESDFSILVSFDQNGYVIEKEKVSIDR
jgi:hypothetical protein